MLLEQISQSPHSLSFKQQFESGVQVLFIQFSQVGQSLDSIQIQAGLLMH